MTKFFGEIGYGEPVEVSPGVWENQITERPYYGDILRESRTLNGDKVNHDITIDNSISILADEHVAKHFTKIKYVRWAGVCWTVTNVEVRPPRLILSLGSVYNGPTS